jgi:alpha-glucuronidase
MTWEEIRQRKEDSIRESTGNPMSKSFEVNGKIYNSYTEYSNSDEHKELLKIQEEALEQYEQKAKECYDSLGMDNQLLLFFYITNVIFENYFKDNGSYRGLLYDKFGFGPEAYSLGMDSGMFALHNSISTPDESEERFNTLVTYLKLDLSKKELNSLRNIFLFGFDSTKSLDNIKTGQQKFDFNEKDPE